MYMFNVLFQCFCINYNISYWNIYISFSLQCSIANFKKCTCSRFIRVGLSLRWIYWISSASVEKKFTCFLMSITTFNVHSAHISFNSVKKFVQCAPQFFYVFIAMHCDRIEKITWRIGWIKRCIERKSHSEYLEND